MIEFGNNTICIIGLGQIGGSLGYDLTSLGYSVTGFDKDASVYSFARRNGIITRSVRSLENGIQRADILILATPIRATLKLLPRVCRLTHDNQIVLDMTGTKTAIFSRLDTITRVPHYFSCHPIAGTERQGIRGATRNLFRGTTCVVIPYHCDDPKLDIVLEIIESLGAYPVIMDYPDHDPAIALTSNLPYAIALSLSHLADKSDHGSETIRQLVGGSFFGATRVAGSSPELTLDMLTTNRDNVANAIGGFVTELNKLRRLLDEGNEKELRRYIRRAMSLREKLLEK